MMKRAMFVLGAVVWATSLTACTPECEVNSDCSEGICVENACVEDERPMTCTSGRVQCSADEICDDFSGECRTCTATAGCDQGSVCDTAANGGDGACVTCTATAGCEAPQICDTSAANGAGACVNCTAAAGNCSDTTPICDEAANNGAGACVTCTAELGCLQGVCDTAANGGAGQCVTCLSDTECTDAAAPFCDVPNATCVACLEDANCTDGAAPFCSAGACGACRDTQTGSAQDEGCSAELPMCDATSRTCREPTCEEDAAYCPLCLGNGDCNATQQCVDATPDACGAPATVPADASASIAAVLAASTGPKDPALEVRGVVVTYLVPDNGTSDPAGFFVQAEAGGPALFVQVDPATLNPAVLVGDRIDFDVSETQFGPSFEEVRALNNLVVVSSEHPAQALDTDTPAGLKVDASEMALTFAEEARLVTITGTVAGAPRPSYGAMSSVAFTTAGNPTEFYARFPSSFDAAISAGCTLTLANAVFHTHFTGSGQGDQSFVSAYHASDVSVTGCPAPQVVEARATGANAVEVRFSRHLDAATVAATDFVITGEAVPTVVSAASVSGDVVTLTTATPTATGTEYTVTVNTLSDVAGTAIDGAANTATFDGFSATAFKLVINEIDYDQPSTDATEWIELYNAGPGPAPLANLQVILINGGNDSVYSTFALSGATDSGGTPATELPVGGYLVLASTASLASVDAGALRMLIQTPTAGDTNIIQNGRPDAVVLFDTGANAALDSISYAGDVGTVTIGSASVVTQEGTESTEQVDDFGTAAVVKSIQRYPNGRDTNSNGNDWIGADFAPPPSPGKANVFP